MTTTHGPTNRLLACIGLAGALAVPAMAQEPATITITGIVRDFKPTDDPGGHEDFENNPVNGMSRYAGIVAPLIGSDGKPQFGGIGNKITQQWRDDQGRQICHYLYDASLGDTEGSWGQAGTGGIISAASFAMWFRDVPVYNLSAPLELTLVRQADGMYLFDDQLDPYYVALDGFFPIDDQLFGNGYANGNGNGNGNGNQNDHNFHFTFEVHSEFQYDAAAGQSFKFEGTDSVFLFIDGKLVTDLVGVHASHDQYVDLDRLDLNDGEWYRLDFFFAQRYEPQSHFRIHTNVLMDSLPIATISAVFD